MTFGFGRGSLRKRSDGSIEILGMRIPALTFDERTELARAPKLPGVAPGRGRASGASRNSTSLPAKAMPGSTRQAAVPSKAGNGPVRSAIEAVWTAPTDAVGLTYGYLGYGLGEMLGTDPKVVRRPGRTEFVNNPFGGVSAITLGRATTYKGNPYDPADTYWQNDRKVHGYPVWEHEDAHAEQARILGPLYLPANLYSGLSALAQGQDWHGDGNYMERGPQLKPPRPWLGGARR